MNADMKPPPIVRLWQLREKLRLELADAIDLRARCVTMYYDPPNPNWYPANREVERLTEILEPIEEVLKVAQSLGFNIHVEESHHATD